MTDSTIFDISQRVARLEVGQSYIIAVLSAVAVPIYFQFVLTLSRKIGGRK